MIKPHVPPYIQVFIAEHLDASAYHTAIRLVTQQYLFVKVVVHFVKTQGIEELPERVGIKVTPNAGLCLTI